uniref:Uncharacterized protein n=1 Tax=Globodera pallida TaxID=36090 RepID=A0A183C833_GLOPA
MRDCSSWRTDAAVAAGNKPIQQADGCGRGNKPIQKEFGEAINPVSYILRLTSSLNQHSFLEPFVLENAQEQLELKRINENVWLLVRRPLGLNDEEQWSVWETEAITWAWEGNNRMTIIFPDTSVADSDNDWTTENRLLMRMLKCVVVPLIAASLITLSLQAITVAFGTASSAATLPTTSVAWSKISSRRCIHWSCKHSLRRFGGHVMILTAVDLPIEYITLILAVDWFLNPGTEFRKN